MYCPILNLTVLAQVCQSITHVTIPKKKQILIYKPYYISHNYLIRYVTWTHHVTDIFIGKV